MSNNFDRPSNIKINKKIKLLYPVLVCLINSLHTDTLCNNTNGKLQISGLYRNRTEVTQSGHIIRN